MSRGYSPDRRRHAATAGTRPDGTPGRRSALAPHRTSLAGRGRIRLFGWTGHCLSRRFRAGKPGTWRLRGIPGRCQHRSACIRSDRRPRHKSPACIGCRRSSYPSRYRMCPPDRRCNSGDGKRLSDFDMSRRGNRHSQWTPPAPGTHPPGIPDSADCRFQAGTAPVDT